MIPLVGHVVPIAGGQGAPTTWVVSGVQDMGQAASRTWPSDATRLA